MSTEAPQRVNTGGCLVFLVFLVGAVSLLGSRFSCFGGDADDIRLSVSLATAAGAATPAPDEVATATADGEGAGLVVEGRAHYRAQPVSEGIVDLEVVRIAPDPVQLSFFLKLTDDGTYSKELLGFARSDELLITARAEVPRPGESEPAGDADSAAKSAEPDEETELLRGWAQATWNYVPLKAWVRAWGTKCLIAVAVLLALVLAVLFTGGYSPRKSRVTFMVIYLMAGAALVVPFLGLYYAESISDPDRTAALPVGILKVGGVGEPKVLLDQWALNIGGIAAESDQTGTYDIKNGLVVPLYVLVLAILGGAVNLLRKVPKLQNDINDAFDAPSLRIRWAPRGKIWKWVQKILASVGLVEATEQPTAAEGSSAVYNDQIPLNKHRGQLIRQVLFLIAAPFLGIVGYYGLMLIEPTLGGRTPFIVLFAFSVGLTTEGFLDALSDWFDKMLSKLGGTENGAPPPALVPSPGEPPEEPGVAAVEDPAASAEADRSGEAS